MFFFFGSPWGTDRSVAGTWTATGAPTPGMVVPAPADVNDGATTGRLRLEVEPAVRVYVDNTFVGNTRGGHEFEVRAGMRRITLRASGHQTVSFDARIVAGDVISYRGVLARVPVELPVRAPADVSATAPDAPAVEPQEPMPPSAPQTFYLIPGCYLGNLPPEQVRLPANCDLSRMITRTIR